MRSADDMLSQDICLSVCLSVCLYVHHAHRYCIETAKHIVNLLSRAPGRHTATLFYIFRSIS